MFGIEQLSEKVIEKMFLGIIAEFSASDLEKAVNDNVSLLLLTQQYKPNLLKIASGVSGNFKGQGHLLNYSNVMKWLEDRRIDLWFKVTLDDRRAVWLKRQVDDFRSFLFGV